MREILFGAKALHDGSWIYGDYIHSKRMAGGFNEFRIRNQDTGMETDIDPETLGQFTGLYDCTKWEELTEAEQKAFLSEKRPDGKFKTKDDWEGRMIFEGDIVENTLIHDMRFVIEHRIDFEFVGYVPVEIGRTGLSRFTDWRTFKIIGNRFDNPRTIKKGDLSRPGSRFISPHP